MTDFCFTQENLEKAKHYIEKYPTGKERSALKSLLDLAQRQNDGWLSKSCIEYVAHFLNIPFIQVMEVASFYTMFNLKPVGKHHIKVCCTTPCWLRGSDDIKKTLLNHLKVSENTITEDGLFTVSEVECLGACVNAPIVQINDDYFEDLDQESVISLIDCLKEGKPIKAGSQAGRQCSKPIE
jgi:NADH-quinone oxidoreductase E subunit